MDYIILFIHAVCITAGILSIDCLINGQWFFEDKPDLD